MSAGETTARRDLPSGTVTFLFTDVVGSTRLWEEHAAEMHDALARHDEIVRHAIESRGGYVVKTTGDGAHAAFATAHDAIGAAVDAQRSLEHEAWHLAEPIRVRIGLHTGYAREREGDYYGPALNRAARLMSIAHGRQIVISAAAEELARDALPEGVTLIDLGEHRLRDLDHPEHVFQVLHPELPRDFPQLRGVDSYPTNLPQQLTSFVGRVDEIDEVATALGEVRIVTLTGVGGVGKTRLAVQTAAEVLPRFSAGAWLCELGPLSDAAGIGDLVATTLAIPQRPGESLTDSIVAALRDREILLVLDNCEHLIAASARFVEALALASPGVRVLATSREGLGLNGERLMAVRSLAVPDEDERAEELAEYEAVRLFLDRAADARRGFTATPENLETIAQICRRLDGIPLAIELAAARIRMMTPAEIAQRLDERFRLLTGGSRTAVERHQTLRAAVDWSYALLEPSEQEILDRLGVFAGGFTFDAAEAVVVEEGSDVDAMELLGQLVDKSLVVAEEDAEGGSRYRLLETIRQYALERLDARGEGDVVRRRHAECYIALAERVQAAVPGPVDDEWVRAADREMPNFRAALDWAIGVGDADIALRLAVPLGEFGAPRPRYTISRWVAWVVDMPAARGHPLRPIAAAWSAQGEISASGDPDAVAARIKAMREAFAEAGQEFNAVAHHASASFSIFTGNGDDAIVHATRAIELSLASGNRRWAAVYSALLANTLATLGETERAIELAEQAIAMAAEFGSQMAPAETALGYALSQTDPERALVHLEAGWNLSREQGNEAMLFVGGACLAELYATRGEFGQALDKYAPLLDDALENRNTLFATLACDSLARALARAGRDTGAAVILGAIERSVRGMHYTRGERYRAGVEAVRGRLGGDAYERAAARGRAMTIEELLEFARNEVQTMMLQAGFE